MENMENKNIMFVLAHYDDEAFNWGTIKKYLNEGANISIVIVCGNGNSLNDERRDIFFDNCSKNGVWYDNLNFFDLTLSDLEHSIKAKIKNHLTKIISLKKIDWIITNNSDDLHEDHQTVSKMIRTVCRPYQTSVKKLYECYIPGSEFNSADLSVFKTIVDISDTIDDKHDCFISYRDLSPFYMNASNNHSKYLGSLYNIEYAEQFKLIWEVQ